jgi:hypothetical protein
MNPTDQFRINTSKIVHETIDGEVVIINFENGNYYSLNSAGKDIWSHIERNSILAAIVDEIADKYQGSQEEIKKDIIQLLTNLEKEELIVQDKEKKYEVYTVPEIKKCEEKLKYEKPGFSKYTDMKEMLLLDPIHEVDETGWPAAKKVPAKKDNNHKA